MGTCLCRKAGADDTDVTDIKLILSVSFSLIRLIRVPIEPFPNSLLANLVFFAGMFMVYTSWSALHP